MGPGRSEGEGKSEGARVKAKAAELGRTLSWSTRAHVHEAGCAEQADAWEKEEGKAQLGRRAGQAKKGRERRAGPVPRAGLKRKKRRFFKINSFSISSFQI